MKYLIVVDMQVDFITGSLDSKCCAGVSVESHNTALDAMRAVQIDIL